MHTKNNARDERKYSSQICHIWYYGYCPILRVCHIITAKAGVNLFCTEFHVESGSGLHFGLRGRTSEHRGCFQNLPPIKNLCFLRHLHLPIPSFFDLKELFDKRNILHSPDKNFCCYFCSNINFQSANK